MNIGVISGGRAANVVPDEAVAQILIRIVENSEPLRQKIAETIARPLRAGDRARHTGTNHGKA